MRIVVSPRSRALTVPADGGSAAGLARFGAGCDTAGTEPSLAGVVLKSGAFAAAVDVVAADIQYCSHVGQGRVQDL